MAANAWVRLPSGWIDRKELASLQWRAGGEGSDNTAALMALTAIAHRADPENGVTRATYDDLCAQTGLSRAKLSKGLAVLKRMNVVGSGPGDARSTYKLANYDPQIGWAKLPAKSMYSSNQIAAFDNFQLRRVVELDALKLFFLFVARRDRKTNCANISYNKIEEYTRITRARIKTAISFLASLSLIYVEHLPSNSNEMGISNVYRVVGVETSNHFGTTGRRGDAVDAAPP